MYDSNALNIYTDGSSYKKPRRGGIGLRFVFPDFLEKDEFIKDFDFSGYKGADNIKMELKACVVALEEVLKLKELNKINRIVIYTDCMYVVENYKKAMFVWPKTKWFTSGGSPVLNSEIWRELTKNMQKSKTPIEIKWLKGHSGNINNEAVDKLAKKSAQKAEKIITPSTIVRRKITKEYTKRGSVKMLGQKIKIRIIESTYLNKHKLYRLRYEVISTKSKFFGKADFIFFKEPLRPAHNFLVTFNKDNNFPQICRVLEEI